MRWTPSRALVCITAAVLAVGSASTGCAAGQDAARPSASAPLVPRPSSALPSARPGISPSGVTTRVDAPAQSTEEEYFQACHAAKTWMQDRHGDASGSVEAYLAAVQAPRAAGAGTWNVTWARLSPAQQAAVIVAARAAAADECG
ncbi:MAG: lipoprotein LpqV [Mycobacterium sp.]